MPTYEKNVIRLSKHNFIQYLIYEMKKKEYEPVNFRKCIIEMMKSNKYNFCYVLNTFTYNEIFYMVNIKMRPDEVGVNELKNFFYKQQKRKK